MNEFGDNVFIRDSSKLNILKKISSFKEPSFSKLVGTQNPFGLVSSFFGSNIKNNDDLIVYGKFGEKSFINKDKIIKNKSLIRKYKLFIPKAIGSGNAAKDWIKPIVGLPNTICTQTFLVVAPTDNETEILNVLSYTQTKFFHFLVSLIKITQDAPRRVYEFVPMQDFSKPWTDKELYEKYSLSQDEIEYIESIIRPMDSKGE